MNINSGYPRATRLTNNLHGSLVHRIKLLIIIVHVWNNLMKLQINPLETISTLKQKFGTEKPEKRYGHT